MSAIDRHWRGVESTSPLIVLAYLWTRDAGVAVEDVPAVIAERMAEAGVVAVFSDRERALAVARALFDLGYPVSHASADTSLDDTRPRGPRGRSPRGLAHAARGAGGRGARGGGGAGGGFPK